MMCAIEAGRRGRRVLVLDHADRAGKKILISGGGRCNFTNRHTRAENFLSSNPHFAKSALARYSPDDFIGMVEEHGIGFYEKTLGQLFCNRSAKDIVTMLERECAQAGVRLQLGSRILSVATTSEMSDKKPRFLLETSQQSLRAFSVVVATGGLSIPKMGATSFGHSLAQQFGLRIVPCRPGLVPLTLAPEELEIWSDLSGLAVDVGATLGKGRQTVSFRERMLFTHRGLSGPAMLQISSFWLPGGSIHIDLVPRANVFGPLLVNGRPRTPAAALQALRVHLPSRLAERWISRNAPSGWTNTSVADFEGRLHDWQIPPDGTEGYTKAEVTVGGVDTDDLDTRTMQSRKVPGLYFVGEVVDVTGWLGGYNFQWAWASGFCAGQAV